MPTNPASPSMMPPVFTASPSRAPRPGALRPAAELGGQLDHLGQPGGPQRVPAPDQAAAGVDDEPGRVDPGVARPRWPARPRPARRTRVTRGRRAPRAPWRRAARPGRSRRARCPTTSHAASAACGQAVVVVEQSISGAGHRTDDTGGGGRGRNRRSGHHDRGSPVGERAAHEPGEDAGHLGRGEHLLDAWPYAGTGPAGCGEAWSNALTAAAAICRTVTPRSSMIRWAQPLLSPIRMLPAGLSSA